LVLWVGFVCTWFINYYLKKMINLFVYKLSSANFRTSSRTRFHSYSHSAYNFRAFSKNPFYFRSQFLKA
jgi:hypothetical protein